MEIDIETIAHVIFGVGALVFLFKVKHRTKKPLIKLVSLNPKENISSVKLTVGEVLLVATTFVLPLFLLAKSGGLV